MQKNWIPLVKKNKKNTENIIINKNNDHNNNHNNDQKNNNDIFEFYKIDKPTDKILKPTKKTSLDNNNNNNNDSKYVIKINDKINKNIKPIDNNINLTNEYFPSLTDKKINEKKETLWNDFKLKDDIEYDKTEWNVCEKINLNRNNNEKSKIGIKHKLLLELDKINDILLRENNWYDVIPDNYYNINEIEKYDTWYNISLNNNEKYEYEYENEYDYIYDIPID